MMRILLCLFCTALFSPALADAADGKKPKSPQWTDPVKAAAEDPDFALQGEYQAAGLGLRASAIGGGQFFVGDYAGGLPGAGWDRKAPIFSTLDRAALVAKVDAKMERVERASPTLGKQAPEGAVVLFAGEANDLVKGEIKDGLLWAGSQTSGEYGSFHLHAEFRVPYKPQTPLSSQDRGNSGLYLQNRYEVQVLDSFGLVYDKAQLGDALKLYSEPEQWDACLYKFKAADLPMSLPPLTWQTFDIDFTAPTFDAGGEKTANARVTVVHNGVTVHDDVELPKGTGAGGKRPEVERGPIVFQGHGNPTAFRNIWLIEK